jgi:serine protease
MAVLALVLFAAVPAGASLSGVEPAPSFVKHSMPVLDLTAPSAPVVSAGPNVNNLINHGGPVQTNPKVYIVFWGWAGSDPNNVAPYLQNFFNGVGGSNWAKVQTQYSSITNPTGQLKGVWWDDSGTYPVVPDAYIGNEAIRAAAHFGYDANANYIIATPHLHNDAQFGVPGGYCAWHSSTTSGGNVIAFTDLPYMPDGEGKLVTCGKNFVNAGAAGLLDGVSIVAGHEYAEAVTDPHLDAWYDSSGQENGDKCAWNQGPGAHSQNIVLSTGTFAIQSLWGNSVSACAVTYP